MHHYHDTFEVLPAFSKAGDDMTTWCVVLLPFLEQANLQAQWDLEQELLHAIRYSATDAGADVFVRHAAIPVDDSVLEFIRRSAMDSLMKATPHWVRT